MQRPSNLQSAMQIAEQVGSALANTTHAEKRESKYYVAVPAAVKQDAERGSFAPMELGTTF